jgi:serine/threonine-protein kinase
MPSSVKDPWLGRTIAQRYRLISRLGAGSVAEVYLARHVLIERLGAIKIAHAELAHDAAWRERFLHEARAVNRINHPNIVEITDYGEASGVVYLVMEYVPGESLAQLVARGPLGWRRAAKIGLQVASALGRAHQMGVVHRDLKPSNVLVVSRRDGDDLAKLTDFGVAKLADTAPLTLRVGSGEHGGAYAAPEQLTLGETDPRSDLFALGVVLHEAAVGARPLRGEGGLTARLDDAPDFFVEVITTLLAADPEQRPRDGFEAADLLRRALERESVSLPPSAGRSEAPPSTPRAFEAGPRSGVASVPPSSGPDAVASARTTVEAAPLDRLTGLCEQALTALEDHTDDAEAHGRPLDPDARTALDEARKLCTTVRAVSDLVASDTRALETAQARGRAARAELGRKLDEVAREHSKTLGWAGTIGERSYQIAAQRYSGEHSVPAVEAMVWEQAALEQEEDRARERAARLAAEMRACQLSMARRNERLEHEMLVVNACLEGRMAALRSLAVEAWAALEAAAARAGLPAPTPSLAAGGAGQAAGQALGQG